MVMTLGKKIRLLRTEQCLTLNSLSQSSGLSVSYLSDIERDRTVPSLETLVKLAQSLQLTVIDLLAGVDFAGQSTPAALPSGLRSLKEDPVYGTRITPEWVELLCKIQYAGMRPATQDDWLLVFLTLKNVLDVAE
jgi:transcriptional regulator with XRE-family HTH domain